jgi:uncharacterized glyoxalase superfamily protein PhnB
VLSETKRWVIISPPGSEGCNLLIAKAANEEQISRIGNQTGGCVFPFLQPNNFMLDFEHLRSNDVTIIREPGIEDYGTVGVFADLYGIPWDLIEPTHQS